MLNSEHAEPLQPTGEQGSLQSRVQTWMLTCFGVEIAGDKQERNHRFLEEALELVQSCGATRSEAHQLVDYTFNRPADPPEREVGGVMLTLAALCLAQGFDMNECGEAELARVWTKIDVIRAKQAAKPKHSPLPEHVASVPPETPAAAMRAARNIRTENAVEWLGYAKSELECHAEWWRQMYQPHFQARARQALDMVADLGKVIAAAPCSPVVAATRATEELLRENFLLSDITAEEFNRVAAIITRNLVEAASIEQRSANYADYNFELDRRCFYCRNKYRHAKDSHDASIAESAAATTSPETPFRDDPTWDSFQRNIEDYSTHADLNHDLEAAIKECNEQHG